MRSLGVLAIAALAGTAAAGSFSETESNNSIATANDIGNFAFPGGSVLVSAAIGDSDVDWYGFTLADAASLSVFAAFSPNDGDGVLQIVTAGGDVIAFDDDSGVAFMPSLQIANLAAGTYYIGFSGFGDANFTSVDTDELFDGIGHSENFDYKLAVGFSIVPAPASVAMLGLGGLMASRRRR